MDDSNVEQRRGIICLYSHWKARRAAGVVNQPDSEFIARPPIATCGERYGCDGNRDNISSVYAYGTVAKNIEVGEGGRK